MRQRSDRMNIEIEWIKKVVENPLKETIQQDGRMRRWAAIEEMKGRCGLFYFLTVKLFITHSLTGLLSHENKIFPRY